MKRLTSMASNNYGDDETPFTKFLNKDEDDNNSPPVKDVFPSIQKLRPEKEDDAYASSSSEDELKKELRKTVSSEETS